jgi:hypothetical protein
MCPIPFNDGLGVELVVFSTRFSLAIIPLHSSAVATHGVP